MPLDGAWSDLTAQFKFPRRDGRFAVVLHDLQVLQAGGGVRRDELPSSSVAALVTEVRRTQ